MGFTPRQVGEMSLWQFMAAADGWARANAAESPTPASEDDVEDVRALLAAAPDRLA